MSGPSVRCGRGILYGMQLYSIEYNCHTIIYHGHCYVSMDIYGKLFNIIVQAGAYEPPEGWGKGIRLP